MSGDVITLADGAGGKASRRLVEGLFLEELRNPLLEPLGDAAIVGVNGTRFAFTTDSYVVRPLRFPGGDIGELAVNGTVNDLAVSGAVPLALTAGFVIEEGFPVDELRELVASMARAARDAGVAVAAGDTKVVERGAADGLYVTTAGVGLLDLRAVLGLDRVRAGDRVLVSGPIADHGIAVMLARGNLALSARRRERHRAAARADGRALLARPGAALDARPDARRRRDDPERARDGRRALGRARRGGDPGARRRPRRLRAARDRPALRRERGQARRRRLAPRPPTRRSRSCGRSRSGAGAAIVGEVRDDGEPLVLVETPFGGSRIVDMLVGDPLPRIC